MADPKHLEVLKQGVAVWNKWREEHAGIKPDLSFADLRSADLSGADLSGADLSGADLSGAHLEEATVGWTLFADVDLSTVKGLDTVKHEGPSTIGIDTIIRSQGQIPESFLRNAGVPDSIY